jgi:alkylation response protein AidB-like acyl-CoA dehydrogenase
LLSTAILGVTAINIAGSETQKTELLGAIAGGELTIALAVDEKIHHDPAQTAMSAEANSDGYVLNGEKRFVIDGSTADKLIVATRTAGSPGDMKGISLFLVDRATSGVTVNRTQMLDGRNAAILPLAMLK